MIFIINHEWTWSGQGRNQIIHEEPRMDTNAHEFEQSTEDTE